MNTDWKFDFDQGMLFTKGWKGKVAIPLARIESLAEGNPTPGGLATTILTTKAGDIHELIVPYDGLLEKWLAWRALTHQSWDDNEEITEETHGGAERQPMD